MVLRTVSEGLVQWEDLDPTKYRENRIAALKKLADPYPHKWNVTISIPHLVEKYKDIEAGAHMESELLVSNKPSLSFEGKLSLKSCEFPRIVSIAGRVKNKRTSGAKLLFYDLFADGVRVQVMCQAQHHEDGDFAEEHAKTAGCKEEADDPIRFPSFLN